ncbi:hypothetical protein L0668_09920 [Paraglaciecola aquimarina]|uniref:Uncharacterized protein n=1 Tax=Paraglaciecola algarum TaxID=3050085 RepID=A0ABS9D674_9ALTE|nr:hypothetical protein [Paraglaciecola sp. G1-23]MCF2948423.1 hypothetical protein [Paraglaciecola sp. G1-23]
MKKILIAAVAALCFASNSFSQENAGGAGASNSASGNVDEPKIVAGAVGITLLAAMIANNRGSTTVIVPPDGCKVGEIIVDGVCVEPPVDPECNGSDPLVDGVCIGTDTTTTVTGTGTNTRTIEVNTTFTYLPTIPTA